MMTKEYFFFQGRQKGVLGIVLSNVLCDRVFVLFMNSYWLSWSYVRSIVLKKKKCVSCLIITNKQTKKSVFIVQTFCPIFLLTFENKNTFTWSLWCRTFILSIAFDWFKIKLILIAVPLLIQFIDIEYNLI